MQVNTAAQAHAEKWLQFSGKFNAIASIITLTSYGSLWCYYQLSPAHLTGGQSGGLGSSIDIGGYTEAAFEPLSFAFFLMAVHWRVRSLNNFSTIVNLV